jgi:cation-transporting ATPase 13A1
LYTGFALFFDESLRFFVHIHNNALFCSMFTLIMLVLMECVNVNQRINSMQRLRDMAGESCKVYVFRSNNWREIDSCELLPGDVVRVAPGVF